ncbi:MAG: type II secretion system protein [Planctomycetaceae bacterium]|nr:type II secretion system protein [Planctomycetaceae bacterium]
MGFSLIELVIVLLIVGILAVVASSRVLNIRTNAQLNAIVTEANRLNRLAMIAQQLNGRLPANTNGQVVPTELQPPLYAHSFQARNPVGALWDWNGPGTSLPVYGISCVFDSTSAEPSGLYTQLDSKFDDGNAATGKIRRQILSSKPYWCFSVQ